MEEVKSVSGKETWSQMVGGLKNTLCCFPFVQKLYFVLFFFILPIVNFTNYPLLMGDEVPVPKLNIHPTLLIIIFMKL